MDYRRVLATAAIAVALLPGLAACGNTPTETECSTCSTVWVINVVSKVRSGVEILLDGDSVYREGGATGFGHRAEASRAVRSGTR